MAVIEAEFGRALEGKVKRRRNSTGKLRSKAERVARGSPEVMVKVTSFGKGSEHVKAHLDYITRNGKVEMESDRGEVFEGKEEVKAFFKDWEQDFGDGKRHKEQRDTMHLVLSMPENTPPEAVRSAVREFARQTFAQNHEYVFALHTDEPHPHCHVTVKMLGHDGRRLNPGRRDLADWREDFAQAMRDQGVDAEATRRTSRGVIRKAENTVVRHIERGDKTHKPRHARVKALKELAAIKEIEAEHHGKGAAPAPPWEGQIKAAQEAVRTAWVAAAKALDKEPPKPIYKLKEPLNERPDYANLDAGSTRQQQRLGAVYQSNVAKARSMLPPRPVTGMRDLPGIPMVHDQRSDKVLLQPDARHRLGRSRGAGDEVRRPRIGDIGHVGGGKRLTGIRSAIESDRALAERIRGFVAAMPAIEPTVPTRLNEIKQDFVRRFTKPREQQVRQSVAGAVDADKAVPDLKERGPER